MNQKVGYKMKKIGFIGAGNMGGAMLQAIAKNEQVNVYVYDVNPTICERFGRANIEQVKTIQEVAEAAELIFLTVKPQYYSEVCHKLRAHLSAHHIVVTVAPGITIDAMHEMLGDSVRVVRTMPNTPAMVGEGVTVYCHQGDIQEQAIQCVESYFNCFGHSYCVSEQQMDAVVPVTGSSPAYGYMFIEAMADAAVKFGLPRQMAYEMAARSLKGTCEMVLQTGKHPGELKDAVTSPAGTTIEAVAKLEETGFRHSIIASMTACYDKTKAMGESSKK